MEIVAKGESPSDSTQWIILQTYSSQSRCSASAVSWMAGHMSHFLRYFSPLPSYCQFLDARVLQVNYMKFFVSIKI